MQPLLYANLSKKTLTETQSGSSISWPRLVAGEDLVLRLRLVQSLDGQVIAARRTISTLKASIGEKDARPLDGSFQIKLGAAPENAGVNAMAKIAHNATAEQFTAALNALSDGALAAMQPFACTARDGSYLVRAANGGQVMFSVADNELWPVSFVTIREFSYDEGHSYEFRLTQAPVAETTCFHSIVPEIPSISTIQTGSENSGVKINEIQRLFIPPENPENFSFRLTFGFKRRMQCACPAFVPLFPGSMGRIPFSAGLIPWSKAYPPPTRHGATSSVPRSIGQNENQSKQPHPRRLSQRRLPCRPPAAGGRGGGNAETGKLKAEMQRLAAARNRG